ncbi:hypothetical protein BGZ65_008460 [Modicella reniformis]|uniref:Uncharacterized protein n=1 Tax=Modicella reniformis TaxID=1440133 RepID=A0A9P6MAR8_9FUNG|nr:hypothetical protein BGZ65_008460 [Modicella reniformis]
MSSTQKCTVGDCKLKLDGLPKNTITKHRQEYHANEFTMLVGEDIRLTFKRWKDGMYRCQCCKRYDNMSAFKYHLALRRRFNNASKNEGCRYGKRVTDMIAEGMDPSTKYLEVNTPFPTKRKADEELSEALTLVKQLKESIEEQGETMKTKLDEYESKIDEHNATFNSRLDKDRATFNRLDKDRATINIKLGDHISKLEARNKAQQKKIQEQDLQLAEHEKGIADLREQMTTLSKDNDKLWKTVKGTQPVFLIFEVMTSKLSYTNTNNPSYILTLRNGITT